MEPSSSHLANKSPAKTIRLALPALLMAILLLAPFYDKAFTIDDTLLMHEAQQIIASPMQPNAFDVVWGDIPMRASEGAFITGPVMGYLLVPSALAGGSELIARLVQIILLCCAAMATISLALRLKCEPLQAAIAGALLVSTPAVLGMAGTSMPDVAAMTFGVMAIERYGAWIVERRPVQGVVSALLLAVALLTRVHMVVLLGVASILSLAKSSISGKEGNKVRPSEWWWLPLVSALALGGAFLWLTYDRVPQNPGAPHQLPSLMNWTRIPANLLAFGVHWVLALPLGFAWLLLRWRALRWQVGLALLTASWILPWPHSVPRWTAPIAALACLAIIDILWTAYSKRDWNQLALGLWLVIGLATVSYFHHPAKYEVPAAPAAAVLIARQLRFTTRGWKVAIVSACIGGGVLLGVAILRADSVLAGLGRKAAAELIAPAVRAGTRVWFVGHWGFQWYAEQAGAHPVTRTPPYPQPGDLVVSSTVDGSAVFSDFPGRALIQQQAYNAEGGRVMSRQNDIGFYSNTWGYLPWGWGNDEINRFEVWRIE